MRKTLGLLFLSISLILTLIACTESDEVKYEAKASDFEGEGFERNSQRIVVIDDELVIYAAYNNPESKNKTSIDKLLESDDAVPGEFYEKRYKNVEIKTQQDMYFITANGLSLTFKKTGERTVTDEEGMEYYTGKYPEE